MRLNQEKKLKSRRLVSEQHGKKPTIRLAEGVLYIKKLFSARGGFLFFAPKRIAQKIFILVLIFSWIFSGWPQIFNFPPEIKEAKAAAFPNGYSFRRLIDITDAQVSSGPHTNFPILFSTTTADLKTAANGGDVTDAQGDDIIFTASDGTTQLAHEVEKYATTTGELVAWVRVPSLTSTSTIYIYYGNSSVTTFQGNVTSNGVTGVWDTNYKGVWHLKEDPSGAAPQMKDATSNANHGTSGGTMTSSDQVAGQIDGSLDFDGSNDYVNAGSSQTLKPSYISIEVWVKYTRVVSYYSVIVARTWNYSGDVYQLRINDTDKIFFQIGLADNSANGVTSAGTITKNVWTHIVATFSGTEGYIYFNGVQDANVLTIPATTLGASTYVTEIGQRYGPSFWFTGLMDEIRISDVARSAGWIKTQYNNQNSPSGFYAIGAETTASGFEQSAYRFFNNLDSTDVGTALAALNTAATLGSAGATFRLRTLIHVSDQQLDASGQAFKLQFATRSGTCDTGFVGETYADVTAATVIAYNNNATPVDGATLTATSSDPTHGADTIVNQTYEELNNFTNSVAAIPAGQDGKWDFSLKDNGATANTAYCLRAVKSDATVLNTYTVIPQITTAAAGALSVDIVDASYNSIPSPTMVMNTTTFSFTCQTVTGSFGTASQQIYVNNNNGANNGWTLTVAAQATTNIWDSAGTDYDFNDPTGSGCTDGADADGVGGQMTVDPSVATLAIGQCGSCTTANISKGSSAAFNQGATDTITLLTAIAASDDVGDWKLTGVSISQKIPAEQPAASDYDINMVLTVTAN